MPCDTRRLPQQTMEERKREIREATERLRRQIAAGTVKVKVGPQGAIAFVGWGEIDRSRVSDACAYRRLLAQGSPELRAALAREASQGRTVNAQAIGQGAHSHDGGETWHDHKG